MTKRKLLIPLETTELPKITELNSIDPSLDQLKTDILEEINVKEDIFTMENEEMVPTIPISEPPSPPENKSVQSFLKKNLDSLQSNYINKSPMVLPLYNFKDPIDKENWDAKFQNLFKDPYIAKKYNRNSRIKDKIEYINTYLPEIKLGKQSIIDLGPGPGEFLEICRYFKNSILGIDAKVDHSEMGNNYMILSKMLTYRQNIPVKYIGFDNVIKKGKLPFENNSISIVNSQGSIEQIFKDYLIGIPHLESKKASLLEWDITKAFPIFDNMLKEIFRVLKVGGAFMIYGNGSKNVIDYGTMVVELAEKNGFIITINKDNRLHKLMKPQE